MADISKIESLLGSGLSNSVVAAAVGVTESYISQLMSDEEFSGRVALAKITSLTANSERDKSIDAIEDRLISRLSDAIDTGQIYKPAEILRAFQVLNAAKRRGIPATEAVSSQKVIVNLTLPTQIVQEFTMNTMGEVIEAGGQTLVTMSAPGLLNKLARERGEDGQKYKELGKFLPGGVSSGGIGSLADCAPGTYPGQGEPEEAALQVNIGRVLVRQASQSER